MTAIWHGSAHREVTPGEVLGTWCVVREGEPSAGGVRAWVECTRCGERQLRVVGWLRSHALRGGARTHRGCRP